LIDFAADLRAPTPTGAAEMIVPVLTELLATTNDYGARSKSALLRLLERRKNDLRATARALPSTETLLAQPRQRLDVAVNRLPQSLRGGLDKRRITLSNLTTRLEQRSPRAHLAGRRAKLESVSGRLANGFLGRLSRARDDIKRQREKTIAAAERLNQALRQQLNRKSDRLQNAGKLLKSFSHENILQRGFALILNQQGMPVKNVAMVESGEALSIQVSDGRFGAVVTNGTPPSKPSKHDKKLSTTNQNDLFS
jgi:exodeoxyribonuclease VII large subunit